MENIAQLADAYEKAWLIRTTSGLGSAGASTRTADMMTQQLSQLSQWMESEQSHLMISTAGRRIGAMDEQVKATGDPAIERGFAITVKALAESNNQEALVFLKGLEAMDEETRSRFFKSASELEASGNTPLIRDWMTDAVTLSASDAESGEAFVAETAEFLTQNQAEGNPAAVRDANNASLIGLMQRYQATPDTLTPTQQLVDQFAASRQGASDTLNQLLGSITG